MIIHTSKFTGSDTKMLRECNKRYLSKYRSNIYELDTLNRLLKVYPENNDYRIQIETLNKEQDKIISDINIVELPYREVLLRKYILGYSLMEIADSLNYSVRQIERLHVKGLEMFKRGGENGVAYDS